MTWMPLLQAAAALLAAGTPWFVVRIASSVAARHARSVRSPFVMPRSVGRLGRATAGTLSAVAASAVGLQPPSLMMGAIGTASFIGLSILGLRALSDLRDASRPACEVSATVRTATLRPRVLGHYLAWPWRFLPAVTTAIGVTLFVWRLGSPQPDRRLLAPLAFACFAVIFLWLYETWMRNEVVGGCSADVAEDEARRRSQLRLIFTVEVTVVWSCLAVAHTLLDLDWPAHGVWGVVVALAGAALGIVACALALSSDLNRRRYLPSTLEPRT